MAAVADFSTTLASIESGHSDGRREISVVKDDVAENSDELMQTLSGKPTRLLSAVRHCISDTTAVLTMDSDARVTGARPPADTISDCIPIFRCGSCDEKGPKSYMEDEHICIDDLPHYLGDSVDFPSSGAFYGVFDGHGGTDAASFIRNNILKFIVEDSFFPSCLGEAIKNAFLKADYALADNSSVDTSSGTTALIAVIFGRKLVVANAGDCRAVLGRRGIAIEMSKDHKPNYPSERLRIEKLGGAIYDGYLNGQLSVSRALGDWHMKRSGCPLSAEPELQEMILTEEDEFLIMGCDGLWDVMGSQCAVAMARRELMLHNDPERCSRELVREAMRRNACDNLTVVVICFSPDPPPVTEIAPSRLPRSLSDERVNLVKRELVRGNNMRVRF